ncbi:hypothetical protein BKA69DRAFT_1039856 [Paraphysoderma sedebokerense]|nr:hypothetical protein BKA69DRAFT_1039856 [Paraphysoderma sedebokerense]
MVQAASTSSHSAKHSGKSSPKPSPKQVPASSSVDSDLVKQVTQAVLVEVSNLIKYDLIPTITQQVLKQFKDLHEQTRTVVAESIASALSDHTFNASNAAVSKSAAADIQSPPSHDQRKTRTGGKQKSKSVTPEPENNDQNRETVHSPDVKTGSNDATTAAEKENVASSPQSKPRRQRRNRRSNIKSELEHTDSSQSVNSPVINDENEIKVQAERDDEGDTDQYPDQDQKQEVASEPAHADNGRPRRSANPRYGYYNRYNRGRGYYSGYNRGRSYYGDNYNSGYYSGYGYNAYTKRGRGYRSSSTPGKSSAKRRGGDAAEAMGED